MSAAQEQAETYHSQQLDSAQGHDVSRWWRGSALSRNFVRRCHRLLKTLRSDRPGKQLPPQPAGPAPTVCAVPEPVPVRGLRASETGSAEAGQPKVLLRSVSCVELTTPHDSGRLAAAANHRPPTDPTPNDLLIDTPPALSPPPYTPAAALPWPGTPFAALPPPHAPAAVLPLPDTPAAALQPPHAPAAAPPLPGACPAEAQPGAASEAICVPTAGRAPQAHDAGPLPKLQRGAWRGLFGAPTTQPKSLFHRSSEIQPDADTTTLYGQPGAHLPQHLTASFSDGRGGQGQKLPPGQLLPPGRRHAQSEMVLRMPSSWPGLYPEYYGATDKPRAARAVLQRPSAPVRRESTDSDVYEDPLLRRNGSLRRGLNVNSTRLQEAVRVSLEPSSAHLVHATTPELDMQVRTLKISELSAELSGLAMIGRGGGGMVFRALWQGALVAAKFMAGNSPACLNMGALEGMLAASVHHPNIVQTYGFDVTRVHENSFEKPHTKVCTTAGFSSKSLALIVQNLDAESARIQSDASFDEWFGPDSPDSPLDHCRSAGHAAKSVHGLVQRFNSEDGFGEPTQVPPDSWTLPQVLQALDMRPGMYMTHIIMELCDRGSLLSALKQGVFRVGGASRDSTAFHDRVVLRAALRTARDVARGMQHLHAAGIIHGDLKPGNVLLKGSRTDRRGFVAKLADFGLSKVVTGDAPLAMKHWSTVAYMAPEGIRGVWCKQSDVYSFGVLLWQLMTGEPEPFKGLTAMQVLLGVSQRRLHLQWPTNCNTAAAQLGEACMAYDARLRPTFQEIGDVLVRIEQNIRDAFMVTSRNNSTHASP